MAICVSKQPDILARYLDKVSKHLRRYVNSRADKVTETVIDWQSLYSRFLQESTLMKKGQIFVCGSAEGMCNTLVAYMPVHVCVCTYRYLYLNARRQTTIRLWTYMPLNTSLLQISELSSCLGPKSIVQLSHLDLRAVRKHWVRI